MDDPRAPESTTIPVEEMRQAAMGRFRFAFEHAAIGMALVSPQGKFLRVNRSLCELLGYTPSGLLATDFQTITHPDDLDAGLEFTRVALAGGDPELTTEKRYLHADGSEVWVILHTKLVRDDQQRPLFFFTQVLDITERRRTEELMTHLAFHDPLTRLPNRNLLFDRIELALARSARQEGYAAVLFIDLDGFKAVNDERGHEVGDQLLMTVADHMSKAVRAYDTVGRMGGDEFLVVCDDITEEEAIVVGERVLEALSESGLSASIGLGLAKGTAETAGQVVRRADAAMYRAKIEGGHRVVVDHAPAPAGPQ